MASENLFPNYLQVTPRLPAQFWWVLRVAVFAATLGLIGLLLTSPKIGLDLFWKLAIPALPLVFAVLPGVWRQVCPMALSNQLPRVFGFSPQSHAAAWAKNSAYIAAVLIFFAVVILRQIVFNTEAAALAVLLAAALVLPFFGGLVFKGRSGWCGTICPLSPLQRAYGQAPVLVVRNGYCPSCVGCQKNCYDFNPRAAIHSDLGDADQWYGGHREFFVGALPGLIIGFFTTRRPATLGVGGYLGYMAVAIAISLGVYMALSRIIRISRYPGDAAVLDGGVRRLLLVRLAADPCRHHRIRPRAAAGLGRLCRRRGRGVRGRRDRAQRPRQRAGLHGHQRTGRAERRPSRS